MPNISASDYTTYLKFKAASASPIRPGIQTRDNVTLSQSVLNANILASQAAFLTTPFVVDRSTIGTTITSASSQTVSAARTDVLSAATANGTSITYTSSQGHGLTSGTNITVTGFTGTLLPTPNRTGIVTVVSPTSFSIPATGAASGTATGTGSITGRVYYTTAVPHGVVSSQILSIIGITFTATNALVLAVPSATTFVLSSSTTGAAVSGQLGTIVGFVYYTTAAAHGLSLTRSDQFVTITNIGTIPTFNVERGAVINAPSSTVFVLTGTTVGVADSQAGVVVVTTVFNPNVTVRGNGGLPARVQGQPPNYVNRPNALSTVSQMTGGVTSSSKFQQPGGLPANGRVGTTNYTRLPQQAGWS